MINATLLEETATHIRSFPELHSQSYFFEQTEFGIAACFAGRALLLSGYTPEFNLPNIGNVAWHPRTCELVPAWGEARTVLGLSMEQAHNLFTPINNSRMIDRKVKDLLNGSPLDTYYELVSVGS